MRPSGRGRSRAARIRACATFLVAWMAGAASNAEAYPIPVLSPGGAAPADSVVLLYPVPLAPTLLTLRAPPFYGSAIPGSTARAAPETLLRAADPVAAKGSGVVPEAGRGGSESLVLSGSKSFAVEVGRGRDASLRQSLDLTLRGRVAGDVEVAGTLRDDALPLDAEGGTRELEDLDRLLISVRATGAEATLGDFRVDASAGEFARVTRRLEGVRGSARAGGVRWDVAAGSAKGERRTAEFRGTEGMQGPYALGARGPGLANAGVVAGSETVWLDGTRLARGSGADYTIDYAAGTLTFTVRRPITAQSRVAVDFEEALTHYRRSLYSAFSQGPALGSGRWFAGFAAEGDDPARTLDAELTSEDRRTLGDLGDSARTDPAGGARHVGVGLGAYLWDVADPANPHWVYVGAGRGEYEIDFTRVGPGRGAYADTSAADGTPFFRYLGRNLGTHVPGGPAPAPSRRSLLAAGGSARLGSVLDLDGEFARSALDRNVLSSRDDADNAGLAGRLGARLEPRRLALGGRSLGTLRAAASVRSRGGRFEPLDRLDDSFAGERWNQRGSGGGEERRDVSLEYVPATPLRVSGELGQRRLDGGSRSTRRAAAAELSGRVAGAVRWEEAANSLGAERGSRARVSIEAAADRGAIAPRARMSEERIYGAESDSVRGRRSRDVLLGLGINPSSGVRLRGAYSRRTDAAEAHGAARVRTRGTTWEAGANIRRSSSLLIDAAWIRRRAESRTDAPAATAWDASVPVAPGASRSDLAQLLVLGGRPGGPISSELRYDVTQLREADLRRRLVEAGAGAGAYDALGNPRYGGGYVAVAASGSSTDRSRASLQLRLDAYPGRGAPRASGRRPGLSAVGSSTLLRLETVSRLPLGQLGHALRLRDYLAEGTTIRGNIDVRQTFDLAAFGGRYDLRAELGARRDVGGEFENLEQRRDARDARIRIRAPLAFGWRGTATLALDRVTHGTRRTDTQERFQSLARGHGADLELGRSLGTAVHLSLLSRYRRDADITRGGLQESHALGPVARCTAGDRLRLDARALLGTTARRGTYAPAGLYVVAPDGRRAEGTLAGEYRLREQVSVTVSWNGDAVAGRPAVHTGRFELRSYF